MELTLDLNKRYTYADYLTWIDDKARELIHGFIKMMSAPLVEHARANTEIFWNLVSFVKKNKGKCEVFTAPFDVRLPRNGERADNKIDTVVQPDICVICDLSKLDERGCCGAPDIVIEVLSISTAKKDMTEKFALYEEFDVKEYWIVNPEEETILSFILQKDGKYDAGTLYCVEGKIPVYIFDNYQIDLSDIFESL